MRRADFTLHASDAPHIAVLAKHHSEVLALFRENPHYGPMAAALGAPVGTVKSRLNRARARIVKLRAEAAEARAAA